MRKIILFCALLAATALSAQNPIQEMFANGLPREAVPAKYYFIHDYADDDAMKRFTEADVQESSLWAPESQNYVFVVQQKMSDDQDFPYLDLWVYDEGAHKAKRVLHQDANNYGQYAILDLHFCLDITTRDSTYTDKKTSQRITQHLKSGGIVLVAEIQEWNGTRHGIISTLIIPTKGNAILLPREAPVASFTPLDNMLMAAEWGLAQNYIITTTTQIESEELYQPTDDFEMFYHQHLTPTLKVYTPKGKLVGSIQCPTDCIDMVR